MKLRLKPMKIERHLFHRKVAKSAEMIDFFSLPLTPVTWAPACNGAGTPAKKNAHALPSGLEASGLEAGQYLLDTKSLREAGGLSLFCHPCPVECEANSTGISRKGKKLPPRRSLRLESQQVSAGTGGEI
jgi:hypothetical protein